MIKRLFRFFLLGALLFSFTGPLFSGPSSWFKKKQQPAEPSGKSSEQLGEGSTSQQDPEKKRSLLDKVLRRNKSSLDLSSSSSAQAGKVTQGSGGSPAQSKDSSQVGAYTAKASSGGQSSQKKDDKNKDKKKSRLSRLLGKKKKSKIQRSKSTSSLSTTSSMKVSGEQKLTKSQSSPDLKREQSLSESSTSLTESSSAIPAELSNKEAPVLKDKNYSKKTDEKLSDMERLGARYDENLKKELEDEAAAGRQKKKELIDQKIGAGRKKDTEKLVAQKITITKDIKDPALHARYENSKARPVIDNGIDSIAVAADKLIASLPKDQAKQIQELTLKIKNDPTNLSLVSDLTRISSKISDPNARALTRELNGHSETVTMFQVGSMDEVIAKKTEKKGLTLPDWFKPETSIAKDQASSAVPKDLKTQAEKQKRDETQKDRESFNLNASSDRIARLTMEGINRTDFNDASTEIQSKANKLFNEWEKVKDSSGDEAVNKRFSISSELSTLSEQQSKDKMNQLALTEKRAEERKKFLASEETQAKTQEHVKDDLAELAKLEQEQKELDARFKGAQKMVINASKLDVGLSGGAGTATALYDKQEAARRKVNEKFGEIERKKNEIIAKEEAFKNKLFNESLVSQGKQNLLIKDKDKTAEVISDEKRIKEETTKAIFAAWDKQFSAEALKTAEEAKKYEDIKGISKPLREIEDVMGKITRKEADTLLGGAKIKMAVDQIKVQAAFQRYADRFPVEKQEFNQLTSTMNQIQNRLVVNGEKRDKLYEKRNTSQSEDEKKAIDEKIKKLNAELRKDANEQDRLDDQRDELQQKIISKFDKIEQETK